MVAFIIWNSNYVAVVSLSNPENDDGMAEGLREGFEMIAHRELGNAELIRTFGRSRRNAETVDVALICYVGHRIEIEGVNYIAPSDVRLESPQGIEFETVNLQTALPNVEGANPLRIVILDAC